MKRRVTVNETPVRWNALKKFGKKITRKSDSVLYWNVYDFYDFITTDLSISSGKC